MQIACSAMEEWKIENTSFSVVVSAGGFGEY
jgi:hypothetical protein